MAAGSDGWVRLAANDGYKIQGTFFQSGALDFVDHAALWANLQERGFAFSDDEFGIVASAADGESGVVVVYDFGSCFGLDWRKHQIHGNTEPRQYEKNYGENFHDGVTLEVEFKFFEEVFGVDGSSSSA